MTAFLQTPDRPRHRGPRCPAGPARRAGGFTLIELMIAVAVVGILGAIAYPSFMDQVRKGRRSDAMGASTAVLQAQERWRANQPTYTAALANLGLAATSPEGRYAVALALDGAAPGRNYTVTLKGQGDQAKDTGCATLTVTVTNGNPAYTPAACWRR